LLRHRAGVVGSTLSAGGRQIKQKIPRNLPEKLLATRVQIAARIALVSIRAVNIQAGMKRRDACRSFGLASLSWATFDLLTLALDLSDDDELRTLIAQARHSLAEVLKR
jgi:hypothetical protein